MSTFETDKVRVFVSSTIRECAEEREVARRAIESLNHLPILFEDIGARAHGPREMYFRGIDDSHIFIAIYKESRGWTAAGLGVSGLEDEFRHASLRGMPRLVYMKENSGTLPPWLGAMADVMERENVTVHFFKDAQNLFERIRDDVEAEVASVFFGRTQAELVRPPTPSEVLASSNMDTGRSLRREKVEQTLLDLLSTQHQLLVHGPMGIGKTVLLAQLANAHGFLFLSTSGLTEKEVVGIAARLLREKAAQPSPRYLDLAAASAGFVAAWRETSDFTLLVDDFGEPERLVELVHRAGGSSSRKRLVVSTRGTSAVPAMSSFELPPLTPDEVETFLKLYRSADVAPAELLESVERSGGNPLYLRYYVLGPTGHHLSSIEAYEKDHWLRLEPKPRNLVRYVALADRPLSFGMLKNLLGVDAGAPDDLSSHLAAARHLLQESRQGYNVVHEHLRHTLRKLFSEQPAEHAHYAARLSEQLVREGDHVGGYLVLDRADDPKAKRLVRKASYQAQVTGDLKASVHILKGRLKYATESGDLEDQVITLLSLSYVQLQSGDKEAAQQGLAAATPAAKKLGDEFLQSLVEEQKVLIDARTTASTDSIAALEGLKKEYERRGDAWGVARIAIDLSEVYVRLGAHKDAATQAEEALRYFESVKDEHGVMVAKFNLAGALGMTPGEEERAAQIFKEVRGEIDEREREREQAWIANVLSIKARRAGDPETALAQAKQAIQLGELLGDSYVVALNRIAAGNALRDAKRLEEASAHYELAAGTAQKSGFRDLESAANELIANICNSRKDYEKAEHFARYAAGLVRGTAAVHSFARAMEEVGESLQARQEHKQAALAYLEGARALANNQNFTGHHYELALDGLHAAAASRDPQQLIEYVDKCFSTKGPTRGEFTEALVRRVPSLLKALDRRHEIPILGVYFRELFQEVSPPIARFLLRRIIDELLEPTPDKASGGDPLLALIPLLAAAPATSLTLHDMVYLGDRIFRASTDISFKPYDDGASHWVIRLKFARPVTCSIQQIDDRVDTALVSMFLALFLKGFEHEIQQDIILSSTLPQNELAIGVIRLDEFREMIDSSMDFSPELPCSVSRPTNPKDPQRVPTFVICREDISNRWHAGQKRGSALQTLFGLTLLEVVYQLFEGAVDMESLRPSIVSVVRRSIS